MCSRTAAHWPGTHAYQPALNERMDAASASEAAGNISAPKAAGPVAQGDSTRIVLHGSNPSAYALPDADAPGGFGCPNGPPTPWDYRAFRFLVPGQRLPIEIETATNLVGGCDLTISPFGS